MRNQLPLSFSAAPTPVSQLAAVLDKLGSSDRRFASDLVSSFQRYGNLTPAQWPHVAKLIARATTPASSNAITLGDFSAVIAMFRLAGAKLKYPKVRLLLGSTPIILSVAGERSSSPGTINVCGEGQYPDRTWYGRVQPSGEWQPARNVSTETLQALTALLTRFAVDPNAVAAAYGRETGSCCFCQRELTDARSVAAGYGPVCAERYGLAEAWAGAADMQGKLAGVLA